MGMKKTPPENIQRIMAGGLRRNEVFDVIPEGASRILDIGYGDGCLLMRLLYEKACDECYGIEINPRPEIESQLDASWTLDLMEDELPEKYMGYFKWIVLHDVLEHIYNPWKFLGIVNKYLADDGHAVIVSPNAQYWEVAYALLHGNWPLGVHGYWNEDHIRWFTFKSLSEVAIMSGLAVDDAYLQLPERFHEHAREYDMFLKAQDKPILELPPLQFPHGHMEDGLPFVSPTWDGQESTKVIVNQPAKEYFPYIMAIKLMLVCSKRGAPELFDLSPGNMPTIRKRFYEKLGRAELEKRTPERIHVQVIRK